MISRRFHLLSLITLTGTVVLSLPLSSLRASESLHDVNDAVQPMLVKIYGAGGFRGLEAYQSGILISEDGLILTVWSYVLDADPILITLHDGSKYPGQVIGADPSRELAVLQIEATGLEHFDLQQTAVARPGSRVLAFSNLFGVATGDEPLSLQHGTVAAITPLAARSGGFASTYRGPAYVLDAMTNNPGAAGGALTNLHGDLIGMLGKELRNAATNTWINYALPMDQLLDAVDEARAGKFANSPRDEDMFASQPADLNNLGIVLVPDVVERTPPFVDFVRPDTPAAMAALQTDDLIVFVNQRLVSSCQALRRALRYIDRRDSIELIVNRRGELIRITLSDSPSAVDAP